MFTRLRLPSARIRHNVQFVTGILLVSAKQEIVKRLAQPVSTKLAKQRKGMLDRNTKITLSLHCCDCCSTKCLLSKEMCQADSLLNSFVKFGFV